MTRSDKSFNTTEPLLTGLFYGFLIGFLISACIWRCVGEQVRQEAVDSGFAEWVATDQGYLEFRWKDKESLSP